MRNLARGVECIIKRKKLAKIKLSLIVMTNVFRKSFANSGIFRREKAT
jgi:hypothetical protein